MNRAEYIMATIGSAHGEGRIAPSDAIRILLDLVGMLNSSESQATIDEFSAMRALHRDVMKRYGDKPRFFVLQLNGEEITRSGVFPNLGEATAYIDKIYDEDFETVVLTELKDQP